MFVMGLYRGVDKLPDSLLLLDYYWETLQEHLRCTGIGNWIGQKMNCASDRPKSHCRAASPQVVFV